MTHWKALKAVDRSFRDLRQKKDTPMGGVLLVLAGDFRQTLPAVALNFTNHLLDIGNGRFPVRTEGKITFNPEIA